MAGTLGTKGGASLCAVVDASAERPWKPALVHAVRQTWASAPGQHNHTLSVMGHHFAAARAEPSVSAVGQGLSLLLGGIRRCQSLASEWLLWVPLGSYFSLRNFEERLQRLASLPSMLYLGVAKGVALAGGTKVDVADEGAGIVLHWSLLQRLGSWITSCAGKPDLRWALSLLDVFLGLCLWVHGIELQRWLDPNEEALFVPSQVAWTPAKTKERPLQRAFSLHLAVLQCLFLVSGLEAEEVKLLHVLVGKSIRWFTSTSCVPSSFASPEATAFSDGQPVLSPSVQKALFDGFLQDALASLPRVGRAARGGSWVDPGRGLLAEWHKPAQVVSSASSRLTKGRPHRLCVFVRGSNASARDRPDVAAAVRSWAAPGTARPTGVEVFIVGHGLPAPRYMHLALPGDADLGYRQTALRTLYLWHYLAANHATDCHWFAMADADTWVNLRAVVDRLTRYFTADEPTYLGSPKTSVGPTASVVFAYNVAVVSRALLLQARPWLALCLRDLVHRNLGRGSGDIALAQCLFMRGNVTLQPLGAIGEMASRSTLVAAAGAHADRARSGDPFLQQVNPCSLFIHPLHGPELVRATELLQQAETLPCPWPLEQAVVNRATVEKFDHETLVPSLAADPYCWQGPFTWRACCDPGLWGRGGNEICWDFEHSQARCCGSTAA